MRAKFIWTKILKRLFFILIPVSAFSQTGEVKTKRLVTDRVELRGGRIDSLRTDTNNIKDANYSIMTAAAVYKLVKQNPLSKGDKGDKGDQGDAGTPGATGATGARGLRGPWIYTVPALHNISEPLLNDIAVEQGSMKLFRFDGIGFGWTELGYVKGEQGLKGDPGTGVAIKGTLADSTLLPSSHFAGDAYLIAGNLWVGDGSVFANVGHIQGPQGNTGATGATGAAGATGATGLASKWLSGTGAPSAGLGDTLSFYLNKTNGDAYTKKTGAWVLDVNLRGPQGNAGVAGTPGLNGSAGKNGNKWITGTAVPSSGIGDTTDIYLRTGTGDVYQKSGAGVWEPIGNLTGPAGSGGGGSSTPWVYEVNASAGQTAFTVPYALPLSPDGINFYRNGLKLKFTKSSNTLTIPFDCDANDKIIITWLE